MADTVLISNLRYEERIVELHSVIAELSRKLEDERDDVIREESEYEVGEEDENDNSDQQASKKQKTVVFQIPSEWAKLIDEDAKNVNTWAQVEMKISV